jgi:PleD family two-component response regulator
VCPEHAVTPSALFNAADQAMYGAKRSAGDLAI